MSVKSHTENKQLYFIAELQKAKYHLIQLQAAIDLIWHFNYTQQQKNPKTTQQKNPKQTTPLQNKIKIKFKIINRFSQWQSQIMVLSCYFMNEVHCRLLLSMLKTCVNH